MYTARYRAIFSRLRESDIAVGFGPACRVRDGGISSKLCPGANKIDLKSEHETLLKALQDELITDMRKQLVNSHVDMRKRTSEAVELSLAEHRKEVGRLEEDRQHFVNALAESINEVTR